MSSSHDSEANRELVRRYFDLWNAPNLGRLDELDELLAAGAVDHGALVGEPPGIAGFKVTFRRWRTAFPDFVATIDDQITEGDTVVTRWTLRGTHLGEHAGVAPSGRAVTMQAVSIDRVAGGKIVEEWYLGDHLALLRQIGALQEG